MARLLRDEYRQRQHGPTLASARIVALAVAPAVTVALASAVAVAARAAAATSTLAALCPCGADGLRTYEAQHLFVGHHSLLRVKSVGDGASEAVGVSAHVQHLAPPAHPQQQAGRRLAFAILATDGIVPRRGTILNPLPSIGVTAQKVRRVVVVVATAHRRTAAGPLSACATARLPGGISAALRREAEHGRVRGALGLEAPLRVEVSGAELGPAPQ